jgi:hypothetical protein
VHRRVALLALGFAALLLTPGATGVPDVPGDPTPPVVTPVITGTLGDAGWYRSSVTVNWSVVDPESIILSTTGCDSRTLTTDTTGTRLTCTAESDGGEATASKTFKLDKTAPGVNASSRPADANGWYNDELTVDFAGSDATSGLGSDPCSPSRTYGGPDTVGTSLVGTCRDVAGNTATASFLVKYDETPPQASAAARPPDANGWYNHAVDVTFQGSDATSGVATCSQETYDGPDDSSVALTGTCLDWAGNESPSSTFTLQYDETAPMATATARTPDLNGWYNAPLTVSFSGSDATSGPASCDAPKTYSSPDSKSTSVVGSCRDRAGNVAQPSFAFNYDRTPPQVTATPERQPNANQWYNAPLEVSFAGTDPISGGVSCETPKTYSSPDSLSASLTGTCRDEAGNLGSTSFGFKYDATRPLATATARSPDANGWYNAPLTVSFAATDALSGPGPCTAPQTYSTPDSLSAARSGTCVDRAGNQSAEKTYAFKYDATPPVATATARSPDANDWYNRALTITFGGSDATSGLASCDPPTTYSSPDSLSASRSGTCVDRAGNRSAETTYAFKYDATAPQATATTSRQPNANGWFNAPLAVTFSGADATSGLDSCPELQSYGGPESAAALVGGTCLDKAGNGTLASLVVRYDSTAPIPSATPSRQPDANGWYNAPLTVSFAATDALSGAGSCTAPKSYSTPDSLNASLTGNCLDRAGNQSTETTFAFMYDASAPVVTEATAVRLPDRAGWYNRPVAFSVQGTDATAGIATCPAVTFAGLDGADAAVLGTCLDQAGNAGTKSFPLRYDATGPQVAVGPSREPDASGWYNRPLTVSFTGNDSVSGLDSCTGPESYSGPDSTLAVVGGFCLDKAGNVGVGSLPVHFDATAPQVTGATPERAPDANGWYNHALLVGFQGSDATSEIDACTQARYAGPDSGALSLTGSCRDRAGNGSPDASFTLRYDGTAPTLTGVRARTANRAAVLSWVASADAVLVEIFRSGRSIYQGSGRAFTDTRLQNGVQYRYTVKAYDEAHNAATATATARPTAPLISPAAGATVTAPVRLAWTAVEKATHYNVQVWRRGKIFSAWPKRRSLRIPHSWTYGGRRYRLAPGRYHWFVWPGYGRAARKTYGPLLGSSSFVVRAPRG